jgi:hypothetical protein
LKHQKYFVDVLCFFYDTSESQIVCVKKFSHIHLLQEGTFAKEAVVEAVGTEFLKL